jgi:DNA-binding transcriptional LysR family regulator
MLSPQTFDDCHRALELVVSCDVDVVLQPRLSEPAGDFRSAVVGEQDVVLVAAADHSIRAQQTITTAILTHVPVIISRPSSTYARLLKNEFGELSVREFGTAEAVKRAAANGLGVGLLPRIAVRDQIRAGALVELPWRSATPVRVYAIWPRRLDDWPVLRTFLALAKRIIEEEP